MESKSKRLDKITILGAGSWGSTLAWLYSTNGKVVTLWTQDPEKAKRLSKHRNVEKPLKVGIPEAVTITADLTAALQEADIVVFCCTAQSMREVALKARETKAVADSQIFVSAAKGIELQTFKRMSQVLSEIFPGRDACALSGPNLAAEVLQGMPTATVISSTKESVARQAQEILSVTTFRVYSNNDLIGVELGGALKNVIAIAAGAVDGLNLGTNAKSALMTRGLAEMTRLSVALGAKHLTLSGLSGMGDLVATCYSSLSRNYRLGHYMACGKSLNAAENEIGAVTEGVTTTEAVCELSQKLGIELPIAQQVESTLKGISTPTQAIMNLMTRPLASE